MKKLAVPKDALAVQVKLLHLKKTVAVQKAATVLLKTKLVAVQKKVLALAVLAKVLHLKKAAVLQVLHLMKLRKNQKNNYEVQKEALSILDNALFYR